MQTTLRQGDVLLVRRTGALPPKAVPVPHDPRGVVLAEGEVTGHAHVIADERVAMLADPETGRRWIIFKDGTALEEPALLTHEEHSTVMVEVGTYEVIAQREYTVGYVRRVTD